MLFAGITPGIGTEVQNDGIVILMSVVWALAAAIMERNSPSADINGRDVLKRERTQTEFPGFPTATKG